MAEENKNEKMKENIESAKQKNIDNLKLDKSRGSSSGDSQAEQARDDLTSMNVNNKKDKGKEVKEKDSKVKEKKKKGKIEKGPKKTEAVVNGRDLGISTKQAVAICNMIRGKDVDEAIGLLEEVAKMKRAVPMKGELPHRKGRIMSGRYPVKAVGEFIRLLKSLKANAINHELELEKVRIFCKANVASRPYKRFGRGRFKRSHVEIRLVSFEKKKMKKDKKNDGKATPFAKSNENIKSNLREDKAHKNVDERSHNSQNLKVNNKSDEEDEE